MLGGLRGRFVAALLAVSAVTLSATAVLLLSPLEHRLINDEAKSLARSVSGERATLQRLPSEALVQGSPRLRRSARNLRRRTGSEVILVTPKGTVLASTDRDAGGRFPVVARALATGKTQRSVVAVGPRSVADVAMPVEVDGVQVVVVAIKALNDAHDAAAVVRRAFLRAAAISLSIAVLLGLLLAGRLVRRLRALRDTALRVAGLGDVAEMRADSARDEVGDLTRALVTMQNRLREQEQARRAFVATASHELRTPLASLRLVLELLRDDLAAEPPDVADARAQAAAADAQSERIAKLAAELLDLSRIDAGVPIRAEIVDLGEVARSVVAESGVRAREAGRRLAVTGPGKVWAVADPSGAAQILRILIDNAIRHTAQGGSVDVGLAQDDAWASLVVADDGAGVAAGDRERIFERFERGAGTSEAPGFGLGLAIGRELARRMQGELTLDDGPSGGGATFRLRLPAAPGD